MTIDRAAGEAWPALPFAQWRETYDTLHMWAEVIGKIKKELCPLLNEWWHVTLHPAARGLMSGRIPYNDRLFEIDFDFIAHELRIADSDGNQRALPLRPQAVADFYGDVMGALASLGMQITINTTPDEVSDPIAFQEDRTHRSYDREAVERWWRVTQQTTMILDRYRSGFSGKASPVHLFWGGFDLAHTRFSGRDCEPPAGVTRWRRMAEDQEAFFCGFWPGSSEFQQAAFYAYHYPKPEGYEREPVRPEAAHWDTALGGEFVLLYDYARAASSPAGAIEEFFQSTYKAAADLARWNRDFLERPLR